MISIYDCLARVLYDDLRGVEYPPFKAMNDDVYANRINNPSAKACIYCINASLKLNSDIAVNFQSMLVSKEIELLVEKDEGIDEIKKCIPHYNLITDPDEQLFYERPYLETMLAVAEIINLQYEKLDTGVIRIREQSGWCKDRYTSISYGCLFAAQLARDLLGTDDELDFADADLCVSSLVDW